MYRSGLQDQIRSYQQDEPISSPQARKYNELDRALAESRVATTASISIQVDELKDYLQAGTSYIDIDSISISISISIA